MSHSDNLLF